MNHEALSILLYGQAMDYQANLIVLRNGSDGKRLTYSSVVSHLYSFTQKKNLFAKCWIILWPNLAGYCTCLYYWKALLCHTQEQAARQPRLNLPSLLPPTFTTLGKLNIQWAEKIQTCLGVFQLSKPSLATVEVVHIVWQNKKSIQQQLVVLLPLWHDYWIWWRSTLMKRVWLLLLQKVSLTELSFPLWSLWSTECTMSNDKLYSKL